MKKEQNELPNEKEEKQQSKEFSRRDFLVGAGSVIVGSAVGGGLLSSCAGETTVTQTVVQTSTKTVPTTITSTGIDVVTTTETVGAGVTVTSTKTVQEGGSTEPWQEEERSYLHMHAMAGFSSGGEPGVVDEKNGKIVRIRPLHLDQSYSQEELSKVQWSWEARGKTFTPPLKGLTSYYACAYKKRVYSPNRIRYPLQRVDWEPGGDPEKINAQNRGKSKFKRITWDEATTMIADEIKRVQGKYGEVALMLQGDGHGEAKNVHAAHGCNFGLFDKIGVQYTTSVRNPDSWEGWYWGTKHITGNGFMGMPTLSSSTGWMGFTNGNLLLDVLQYGDMVVWMGDWETTPQGFTGQSASLQLFFMNEVGIKQIFLCPDLNYAAAVHAYKWIPVLPCADTPLFLAILYIWITEGTLDEEYLNSHTVGWDTYKAYVMGESDDMQIKTPEWASSRCGVPVYTIKALAREWASNKTSTGHYYGGPGARGPYSHEVARVEMVLLAAQGWGGPGVQCIFNVCGVPRRIANPTPGGASHGGGYALSKQNLAKTLHQIGILEHDMDNPISFWGSGSQALTTEDQFIKYTYPIPAEEGGSEIHMIWCDNPCHIACWLEGNIRIESYRSPKIECIVTQHISLENDCLFSDIILPINTMLEEEDVICTGAWINLVNYHLMTHTGPGVQPIGESKTDLEAVIEVAKKLGDYGNGNAYEIYTGGKSLHDYYVAAVNESNMTDYTDWDDVEEKGYFIAPLADDWENDPRGFRDFYENPENNPLMTPSGLVEIYSDKLAEYFPDDNERGPYPKYVVGGPDATLDESIDVEYGAEKCKTYPFLMQSQHPRWRTHVQCDDIPWLREIPTCKVKGYDGYMYEPLWIHPADAESKGIKNGDIVKIWNDHGIELGGAYITERVRPGALFMDHGARIDYITDKINRGGTLNELIPSNKKHKYLPHLQIATGFLVDIEKLDPAEMQEWRDQYPEAFGRAYDPSCGLKFDAWVEGGMD